MSDVSNPRAVIGDNKAPDYAQRVTEQLLRDHAESKNTLDGLLAEAGALPKVVDDDQTALKFGAVIKRLRDLDKRLENHREVEKEPFLRGGNAVDAFFNGLRDKCARRNQRDRKAPAGAADILQARIDDYQERKIAEETRIRNEAAAKAAREAREAHEKAERDRIAAEEAAAAAARARKPENVAKHTEAAEQKGADAAAAAVEAQQAHQAAEEARIATLARPADMARVRGATEEGAGVTLTVKQEPFAMVVDRALLDMDKLRHYFTDAELDKALRQWAKSTGHREKMPGAEIGFRNVGVTR